MAFFHFDSLLSEADASLEMRTSEHQCVLLGDKRDLWASGGGVQTTLPAGVASIMSSRNKWTFRLNHLVRGDYTTWVYHNRLSFDESNHLNVLYTKPGAELLLLI